MSTCSPLKNPLILALDVDDDRRAYELVDQTGDLVGGIKVGPRLMLRYGPQLLKKIANQSPVFLDMKFFDIPSTMVSAVRSAFDIGAKLVTIHAQAGVEALSQLAKIEEEYQKTGPVKILAVTILTSFDKNTLPSILRDQSIADHVSELVGMVKSSGLNGIVCSPQELSVLSLYDDLFLVTPGIRTEVKPGEDQKRVMGPREAIQSGARAIVVGRPILETKSPALECEKIINSLCI